MGDLAAGDSAAADFGDNDLGDLAAARFRQLGRHLNLHLGEVRLEPRRHLLQGFRLLEGGFDLRDRLDVGDALGDERGVGGERLVEIRVVTLRLRRRRRASLRRRLGSLNRRRRLSLEHEFGRALDLLLDGDVHRNLLLLVICLVIHLVGSAVGAEVAPSSAWPPGCARASRRTPREGRGSFAAWAPESGVFATQSGSRSGQRWA